MCPIQHWQKNLKLQLSSGLVTYYDMWPGNRVALFWDTKYTHTWDSFSRSHEATAVSNWCLLGSCIEQTWSELAASDTAARLGKDSLQEIWLDGDCTGRRESKTGASSLGLHAGTAGVITRSETRHVLEGKKDAVVTATRCDAVHNADDEALRDIVCSPTNTLLNWYTCLQANRSFTLKRHR